MVKKDWFVYTNSHMAHEEYKVTIGLEIHAELKTKTKMFCNSKNDPDEKRPNVNICPICMGHPGTLPTINKEAVKHVVRVGVALGGKIADFTEFDRKNYFYPDIPKGYQISQYKYPLVSGGELNGVALTRIHLEEDTARSSHPIGEKLPQGDSRTASLGGAFSNGASDTGYSLVDFNRAGIPLMELVTEPVIHSAEQASAFAKELQLLLQTLGVGDANMEKGEMRVEANISVSKTSEFGTKCEVKNLNSFRAVERAIAFEVERHIYALEHGEKLVQETRGWDETKEVTFSQRAKEDSHDYRYFPEPDLPKLWLSKIPELLPQTIKATLPELPWDKRARLSKLGLKPEDVEVFVRQLNWGKYFENIVGNNSDSKFVQTVTNYITSDLAGLVKADTTADISIIDLNSKIPTENFTKLITMISEGKISSRGAKDLLKMMYEGGGDPEALAGEHDLLQKSDEGHLTAVAQEIINNNPTVVADYKSGKESALQFFVGQGMKATKGSGNPAVLKTIFEKLIKG
jgi:aspartyl-tRNA(Asn)/glutamyl-tRNA(Gln) amidotransferase subunit B